MSMIIRNFRQWWQKPQNLADRQDHRQVTFLELFYDLTYVVIIAELTHSLATHIDLLHIAQFAFLFFIVYWAWLNGTLYHDIHGNNDIRTRIFTFLQMFTVASMAIFAHDAFGETAIGFALSYAGFQIILTYLWWRTGVHDPAHRPLSQPYSIAFLINTALFIGSVFVEPPLRFYLWGIATVITLVLPLLTMSMRRNNPEIMEQMELSSQSTASLVERFGLFTIIVLGEVIVGTVQGVAGHHDLTWDVGIIGAIGMAIAIGLWWLYFDFVSHRRPKPGRSWLMGWMYSHLPVAAGIAVTGAAVLNVVEHAGETLPVEVRWMLVTAIAVTLAGVAMIIQTLDLHDNHERTHNIGQIVMLVAAGIIFASGFSSLETIPLLSLIVVLMLAPVFSAFLSWLAEVDAVDAT